MAPLTWYFEGMPLHGLTNCFEIPSEGRMIRFDKPTDV